MFYGDLSKAKEKSMLLSLMSRYHDSYIPETEANVLPKPLNDLHDPVEIKKMFYMSVKA